MNKPCVLEVDASDTGLGRALLKEGQPVAFTSSALSATEINYASIEKECLALKVPVWQARCCSPFRPTSD